jgi:hypothetical protein
MNSEALIMMLAAEGIITAVTIYFFYKVLTVPPKAEPDSYSENDDD